MESKFSAHYDAVAADLSASTVGLLTVKEMKNRQESAVKEREMQLARKNKEELRLLKKEEKEKEKAKKKQSQQIKALSFNMLEDEDGEEEEEEVTEEAETNAIVAATGSSGCREFLKKKRLGM